MENQQNNAHSQDNDPGRKQNDTSGYEDAPESGRGVHNINDTDTEKAPKDNDGQNDNSGYDDAPESGEGIDDTDKYLAMEQPGVTYTHETDPTVNSDHANYSGSNNDENTWNEEGGNSRNSDAFNQDDYILEDNVDFDEDQNQSISSDDEDFEETNERYTN
jgi:hypothetical protein